MMNNRVYSLAIVGCGKVAAKHARAIRESNKRLQLSALVDSSEQRARQFAEGNQIKGAAAPRLYTTLGDMLLNEKPDIIAITTPSGSHYALAREALQAGSHVLIEKPMTLDLEEARDLERMAKSANRLIVMGHIYRYFPLVHDLQRDLAAGVFGRILSGVVTVRWGHDQAYYDSASWRGTWSADGGVLMNQTIHALDLMCWLMNSAISEAQGQIRRLLHDIEAEDFATAICTLANGAMLQIEGTTATPPDKQMASFYILTELAEIEAGLRSGKPYLKVWHKDKKRTSGQYIRRALGKAIGGGLNGLRHMAHPHSAIYKDFVACLDQPGRVPLADAKSGVSSVEHILAIYRSAKYEGQVQTLPIPEFSLEDMRGLPK